MIKSCNQLKTKLRRLLDGDKPLKLSASRPAPEVEASSAFYVFMPQVQNKNQTSSVRKRHLYEPQIFQKLSLLFFLLDRLFRFGFPFFLCHILNKLQAQ